MEEKRTEMRGPIPSNAAADGDVKVDVKKLPDPERQRRRVATFGALPERHVDREPGMHYVVVPTEAHAKNSGLTHGRTVEDYEKIGYKRAGNTEIRPGHFAMVCPDEDYKERIRMTSTEGMIEEAVDAAKVELGRDPAYRKEQTEPFIEVGKDQPLEGKLHKFVNQDVDPAVSVRPEPLTGDAPQGEYR